MTAPCEWCGAVTVVQVLLPGHADIEAVICLTCGRPQPAHQPQITGPDGAEPAG